ncbi:hypothetical protein FRX31_010557 [Thalictrum thalictroides]|uniref:Transmembrane protein n=1 Tax=Thalictrum thalictroides TaxID=46969 RepID=A0A7J6WR40_THATH|nr:hypothetical protein FRX31_010557 [Thalictrum thalictroides]
MEGIGICGVRLWFWSLVFGLGLLLCSASSRNSILIQGNEAMELEVGESGGRSLKAVVDDYSDPSANKGHDPKNKGGGSDGRTNRDQP